MPEAVEADSFGLTPHLGFLALAGGVTPVPSCFHPSLWHLLVGCGILSPTFPLQQAPSQPARRSPERTG